MPRRDCAPGVVLFEGIGVTKVAPRDSIAGKAGIVLHAAARYDFMVALLTLGRARAFRERILHPVRLAPGETVLDVGCGTGTLTIAAKRQVGATGRVCGVDASPEMIARARTKAQKAGLDVAFGEALAQTLPFPAAQFDAVLTTVMLHHLPRAARGQCIAEMRRVAKPGGRILAVDFGSVQHERKGFLAHFHRHGHIDESDLIALLSGAGLTIIESGAVGMNGLQFALGVAPC